MTDWGSDESQPIRRQITPPWLPSEVEVLNAYQQGAPMHPFTCPHRDSGHMTHGERDIGILVARADGWYCRDCDYRQFWAHPFMADHSWW